MRSYIEPMLAETTLQKIGIRPINKITVKKLIFEKKQKSLSDDMLQIDIPFRIWEADIAGGNEPIYLICDKYEHVGQGTQYLTLQRCPESLMRKVFRTDRANPMSSAEFGMLTRVCNAYGLYRKEDGEQYPKSMRAHLDTVVEEHQRNAMFFNVKPSISREDLRKLRYPGAVYTALDVGLNKDKKLLDVMAAMIPGPVPNKEVIDPHEWMQFAPHSLIISATKPGKTTTARKVCSEVVERPTVTYMVGSSDLRTPSEGRLNKSWKPFAVDGIEEFSDAETHFLKGFLNVMEVGTAHVGRGGPGAHTETWSPLMMFTNPESTEADKAVENIVTLMHSNLLGMGSRLALFVVDLDMREPDGIPMAEEHKLEQILESLQLCTRPVFTKIIKNDRVQDWLRRRDKTISDYRQKLEEIAGCDELSAFGKLSMCLQGMKKGWKHLKGAALRLGFVDNLDLFLQIEKYQPVPDSYIGRLIKRSRQRLKELMNYNLLSFQHLLSLEETQDLREQLRESRIAKVDSICTTYEQLLLWTVSLYVEQEQPDEEHNAVPLSMLRDYYLEIPKEVRSNAHHNSFVKLLGAVENNLRKVNQHRGWLGLRLKRLDEEILVEIVEREWVERYRSMTPRGALSGSSASASTANSASESQLKTGKTGKTGAGRKGRKGGGGGRSLIGATYCLYKSDEAASNGGLDN